MRLIITKQWKLFTVCTELVRSPYIEHAKGRRAERSSSSWSCLFHLICCLWMFLSWPYHTFLIELWRLFQLLLCWHSCSCGNTLFSFVWKRVWDTMCSICKSLGMWLSSLPFVFHKPDDQICLHNSPESWDYAEVIGQGKHLLFISKGKRGTELNNEWWAVLSAVLVCLSYNDLFKTLIFWSIRKTQDKFGNVTAIVLNTKLI